MPVNLTGPRDGPARPGWVPTRQSAAGPQAGFFAVVLIAVGCWVFARATLPGDLAMPLVASLFLGFAAVFGLVAWRQGRMDPSGVTYRDVAGALTLIGVCAAAAIDPEQMVRIVQADGSK